MFVLLSVGAGLTALPASAFAQERPLHEMRGSFLLGAFLTEPATSVRLSSTARSGTDISLEGDLGLPESTTVARLGGYYWLGGRGRLDFSLFRFSRNASKAIDTTIDFGDQVFPVNTVVTTKSEVTIFKAAYTFAAIDRERGFFGVTGGLYTASNRLDLNDTTLGLSQSNNLNAPLPVVGLRGSWDVGRHFAVRGSVEWFGITTNKASGRLLDSYLGADYSFGERVALGLAYNNVDVSVSAINDRGLETQLDWGYDGTMLYVKVDFGR